VVVGDGYGGVDGNEVGNDGEKNMVRMTRPKRMKSMQAVRPKARAV